MIFFALVHTSVWGKNELAHKTQIDKVAETCIIKAIARFDMFNQAHLRRQHKHPWNQFETLSYPMSTRAWTI